MAYTGWGCVKIELGESSREFINIYIFFFSLNTCLIRDVLNIETFGKKQDDCKNVNSAANDVMCSIAMTGHIPCWKTMLQLYMWVHSTPY